LNYRFALPNKIFDYIQAGVPIIVSGMPEMQRIVEKYHTGEVFLGETASELALRINNILSNPSKLENYHQNCITAADELCWEKEAKVLLDIFAGLT
jgi:glycosyltransferase involved in cell wall biosynthesis